MFAVVERGNTVTIFPGSSTADPIAVIRTRHRSSRRDYGDGSGDRRNQSRSGRYIELD